jgi:hypothetical protein
MRLLGHIFGTNSTSTKRSSYISLSLFRVDWNLTAVYDHGFDDDAAVGLRSSLRFFLFRHFLTLSEGLLPSFHLEDLGLG